MIWTLSFGKAWQYSQLCFWKLLVKVQYGERFIIKYKDCSWKLSTKNLTWTALRSFFSLTGNAFLWLKNLADMYLFPDENGIFPTLDTFMTYGVEVGPSKEDESHNGSKRWLSKDFPSASDESLDENFLEVLEEKTCSNPSGASDWHSISLFFFFKWNWASGKARKIY